MPEIRQNMNMKLVGWIAGRQRIDAEYTPHSTILIRMRMSPVLNERCVNTPGSSLVMIASTPRSEIRIPASWPVVSRSPNIAALAAAMNSGANEFITDTFSAVVSCRPTNCSAPKMPPPMSDEIDHHAEMPADQRPVADEMRADERKQHRGREQPAQRRDRERRHMAGDRAAHQVVAGPAQACEREHQIRVAEQAARERGLSGLLCGGHGTESYERAIMRAAIRPLTRRSRSGADLSCRSAIRLLRHSATKSGGVSIPDGSASTRLDR